MKKLEKYLSGLKRNKNVPACRKIAVEGAYVHTYYTWVTSKHVSQYNTTPHSATTVLLQCYYRGHVCNYFSVW